MRKLFKEGNSSRAEPISVSTVVSVLSTWDKDATTRRTRKVSTPGSVFLHYEAYSWAGQIIQTKTFLFHYCPTQPKYRQLKTAQIYNVNFKAIWWFFFKSSSDNMLNLINDFRFISVLQWYLKVLRPFEVLLLCQKLLISLIELVNVYRHDQFCIPSCPGHVGWSLILDILIGQSAANCPNGQIITTTKMHTIHLSF